MNILPQVNTNNNKKLNYNRNMNKNRIRLTEQQFHRVIKESVNKILNEIGDTNRGQYMLGRVGSRASNRGDYYTMHDAIDKRTKDSDVFDNGWNDEKQADSFGKKINYDANKMIDMENIGRKFIDFIEGYRGGMLLQTIVDYESGNQTGTPTSPLGELIPYFEDEVLGYESTPDIKQAIKRAYNQWWFYAEDQLMPSEEEF